MQRQLAQLLTSGARTEARILAHLASIEERRLHLRSGCSSLFAYCVERLGLSENQAFHRLTAARLARRFPLIFRLVEQRKIHLTGVCLLRDCLNEDNHAALLNEACGKTKLQVLELIARRHPRPDLPSTIRKLPAPAAATPATAMRSKNPAATGSPRTAPEAQAYVPPSVEAPPFRARPWARSGGSGSENLKLLCAAHNRLLAERDFGREKIANSIHFARAK